jgi:integrase/recombinase XerD
MKLLQGVQTYVDGKRLGRAAYAKGIQSLTSSCRHAGDVSLGNITERQVTSFLDGPRASAVTWRLKYNLLRNFFLFWVARKAVPALPMPPPRPPLVTTFVPYIYSRTEIRLLLFTVRSSQKKNACKIDALTHAPFAHSCCFSTGREPWSVKLADCYVRTWISNGE